MAMAKDPTTYGGRGGNLFDDGVENVNIVGIRTVNIRSGNQMDAIQVDYVLSDGSVYKGPFHGGCGGSASTITLANGEWICKVEGKTNGSLVDQLTLSIKNAAGTIRKEGPFGKTGTTVFMKEGNIVALHGGAGDLLDRIGFYDLEDLARPMSKSRIFGGSGGGTFDDFATESGIVGIQKIYIRAGNQVDGIQVVYRLANGRTWTSGRHGGGGGTAYSFSVGVGDFISKIEGKTNGTLVDQLTFTVTKDNGSTTIHGPYGRTGKTPFSVAGNVVALCGRAGNLLDGVGFYLYAPLTRSKQFGGSNGDAFNDDPNTLTLPEAGPGLKISKLYIRSGNQVDSIRAEYHGCPRRKRCHWSFVWWHWRVSPSHGRGNGRSNREDGGDDKWSAH